MSTPWLRRRHLVFASPMVVVVMSLFAWSVLAGQGSGAAVAVDVPTPQPRPQLVPRRLPQGFHLVAWSESAGAAGEGGWLDLFSSGPQASDQPWVRVQYGEAGDLPPALAGKGWVATRAGDLEQISGPVGPPAGKLRAVVVGRGLAADDLDHVARGLRASGTNLQPTWLPSGVRRVTGRLRVGDEAQYGRMLAFARDGVAFTLATTYGRYRDVRQLLPLHQDAEVGRYAGSDALISTSSPGRLSIRWLPRPGVLAELEADSSEAREVEPSLADLVPQAFRQFAGRAAYRPLGVGAGEDGRALVTLDGPLVPVLDTAVGGGRALALAGVGTNQGGERVLCLLVGGGGGCGGHTSLEEHHAIRATRGPSAGGEAGAWLVVDEEVHRVVVRYRGLRPRSVVPVQPSPTFPDRLVFVYQPPNHAVRSIELMSGGGDVLARVDAPIGPEMLALPR